MRSVRELHAVTHKRLALLLEHLGTMPAEMLSRHLQGFGKPTIARQVNHVLYSELAWVGALQNRPQPAWDHEASRLATLVELRRDVAEQTIGYIDGLTDEQMHSRVPVYPDYWVGVERTPSFILHHVVTHAFHHKGQIVAMCRILGHPAPDTDLQQG